jgi:hypothetical protein
MVVDRWLRGNRRRNRLLAEAAGLGLSTIVDFEKSRRDVSRAAVHAMQKALEKAGIQFIAKNGRGPGVRLRQ